jgi:hypothetical protein
LEQKTNPGLTNMKKIIAACTLAVGVLGAANSFGAAPATSGPVYPVTISNGTITYDPVGAASTSYKSIYSTVSPTLLTKTFGVADLIKVLNHGYTSSNIIYDVTGVWQIPSDAYLVWTPQNEFGVGTNFLRDQIEAPFWGTSQDSNAGNLALVDAGGFYLPLQGTDPAVNPNPVYPRGPYSFAYLSLIPAVYNGAVDQTTLIGSETAAVFFSFSFSDLNEYTDAWGDSFANAFTIQGLANFGGIASTADVTKSTPVGIATDVITGGAGTGYGSTSTLTLGKNNHNAAVDLFNAPGGGNAVVSATLNISGTSTSDTTVSAFFPVNQTWGF